MKSYYKLLICLFLTSVQIELIGQSFGAAGNCLDDDNINCSYVPNKLDNQKRSVAIIVMPSGGRCTGTLLNQHVSQNDLKQYLLTARHCTQGQSFSADWTFIFNYQSPDCDNSSVPLSNQNGSRYRHVSRVRLVKDDAVTDMALLEILDPIPPHYNVYYSGWSTSLIHPKPHYAIHHPRADIKKASRTYTTVNASNYACHATAEVVETTLQFLFGWIIKKEIKIRNVCTYTESPYLTIAVWDKGTTEPGSSGSALFNNNGRIIGATSNGIATCGFAAIDNYGKFSSFWQRQSAVRNALAPIENSNTGWRGFFSGIDGRQVACQQNLLNLNGVYFPASDYQSNSKITLRASNNMSTAPDLRIRENAEFEFKAGNSVVFDPGFVVDPGASFSASIEGCNSNPSGVSYRLADQSLSKPMLEEKVFDITKYMENVNVFDNGITQVYPTVLDQVINVKSFGFLTDGDLKVEFIDDLGFIVLETNLSLNTSQEISINSLKKGLHIVKLTLSNGDIKTYKVIKL